MKKTTLLIFCLILVFVQLAVLDVFFGPLRTPNLVLAAVVCLAASGGFKRYLGWIILSGFLLDAGSGRLLGSDSLLFVLAAFGVDRLNTISNIEARPSRLYSYLALITIISLFVFGWAGFGFANLEKYLFGGYGQVFSPTLDLNYLWKNIFTIIGGFVIYFFVRKSEKNDLPKISK